MAAPELVLGHKDHVAEDVEKTKPPTQVSIQRVGGGPGIVKLTCLGQ